MKAEDYSKVEQSVDRPFQSGISIKRAIERSSAFYRSGLWQPMNTIAKWTVQGQTIPEKIKHQGSKREKGRFDLFGFGSP
jgi:hypothetical protein